MTPAGRGTLLAGVLIVALGILSGYPALTTMGATLLAAVVVALLLVGRRADVAAVRRIRPDRVTVGDEARTELTITNRSRRPISASTVFERVGDTHVAIDIPALDPDESIVVTHELPTDRRGVFAVGPLTVRLGDPLGLARRGDAASDQGHLIVHPAIHDVSPSPTGLRRDMEGLPSGEAVEGGITFSNLREYVPGDDLRLVHWKSSAHVGDLMVRHNIDVHRPRTSVILDTAAARYDHDDFEAAVRATASLVVAAMTRRFPFSLRTTHGETFDDRLPRLAVMDFLAAVAASASPSDELNAAVLTESRNPTGLSCAVVTGAADDGTVEAVAELQHRVDRLTIVRMGVGSDAAVQRIGRVTVVDAATSEDFAHAWNQRTGGSRR